MRRGRKHDEEKAEGRDGYRLGVKDEEHEEK
jgi:hypothetical protein